MTDQETKINILNAILADPNNILFSTKEIKKIKPQKDNKNIKKKQNDKPTQRKKMTYGSPLKITIPDKKDNYKNPTKNNKTIQLDQQLSIKRAQVLVNKSTSHEKQTKTHDGLDCKCPIHMNHMKNHILNVTDMVNQLNELDSEIDWDNVDDLYVNILSELNCADSSFLLSYVPIFTKFQLEIKNSRGINVLEKINKKQFVILQDFKKYI